MIGYLFFRPPVYETKHLFFQHFIISGHITAPLFLDELPWLSASARDATIWGKETIPSISDLSIAGNCQGRFFVYPETDI